MRLRRVGFVLSLCVLLGYAAIAPVQALGADFNMQQAGAYIAAHNWDMLIRYSSAWSEQNPRSADAWASLGIGYGMGLHRPADAIRNFQRALALRPNWPECLNAMGVEYVHMQDFSGAQGAFGRAAALAPQKPNYWNNLAVAYSELNDRTHALQALDSDRRLAAPRGGWGDWYVLGNGYYQMLAYPQALQAYQQALRMNPRSGAAWNNFGNAQHALGDAQDALRDYRLAASLGDSLGAQNLRSLQQAIQAAQQAAREASQPMSGVDRIAALNSMKTAYAHEWHDPASLTPPP
jgi:tetratricopeptide (TPR) repeat protein